MPLPNTAIAANRDPVNNFQASGMPNTVDYRSFNGRIDFQASARHRFFVRWLTSSFLEGAQDFTYSTEPGLMNWDEERPAYTVAADWTYALSAIVGSKAASSSANRTSAMSRSRCFRSFCSRRVSTRNPLPSTVTFSGRRTRAGVAAGRADQSGSAVRIAALMSDVVSPRKARRPVSIS